MLVFDLTVLTSEKDCVKRLFKTIPCSSAFEGYSIRLLDLGENLRFSYDHGISFPGDPTQMSERALIHVHIYFVIERFLNPVVFSEKRSEY